jgi:hypothetical protein
MKKNFAMILVGGWWLWAIHQAFDAAIGLGRALWHSSLDPGAIGRSLGYAIGWGLIPALGAWLAWQLWRRPRRSVAVWFSLVCIFSLWKFWIGIIVVRMLPAIAGESFAEAIGTWWHYSTSSLGRFLDFVPPIILLLVSLCYWGRHCVSSAALSARIPPRLPDARDAGC